MDNIADALKIAFAVFVFVIALALTFSLVSKAKSTADYVFYYGDRTNFYEPLESKGENRRVGVEEIISTLYGYYNESIHVTIVLGNEEDDIHKFNLEKGNSNTKVIEKKIGDFINDNLNSYNNREFEEEFIEVPMTGIFDYGEDGTEITKSSGGKKVYITYTLVS